jgi:hypothetical protein
MEDFVLKLSDHFWADQQIGGFPTCWFFRPYGKSSQADFVFFWKARLCFSFKINELKNMPSILRLQSKRNFREKRRFFQVPAQSGSCMLWPTKK